LVGAGLVAARVSLGDPSGAGRTRAVVAVLEADPDPEPDPDADAGADAERDERDAERDELAWRPAEEATVRLAAAVPPHPTSAHPTRAHPVTAPTSRTSVRPRHRRAADRRARRLAAAGITVAVAARTPSRLGAR